MFVSLFASLVVVVFGKLFQHLTLLAFVEFDCKSAVFCLNFCPIDLALRHTPLNCVDGLVCGVTGQLLVGFYPPNAEVTFPQPAVPCRDLSLDKSTLGISELPPALMCILCQSVGANYISLLACDETICQSLRLAESYIECCIEATNI